MLPTALYSYEVWDHLSAPEIELLERTQRYAVRYIQLRNKSWKPECVGSFNMDWLILVFYPEPEARDKIY